MSHGDGYVLRCEMTVEASRARVFEVFENPYNLARITPPWLNFRVITPDLTMRRGLEINYAIRWMGLPMRWRSAITSYDPPESFVDEQLQGPYGVWRHLHLFEETAAGTRVADEVRYVLPLGALGRAAHAAMVGRQLLGIFRYRQRALEPLLGRAVSRVEPWIERGEAAFDTTRHYSTNCPRRNCQSGIS